ncbi:MAG: RagB/SusD family nutrient uptake outer membrane protein [Maribacter dokdonensis]|uniref:Starch-binding associating with outer membrane n=3 Tax=Maribacter TaxID=252356 RepID=A0A1H4LPW9_9FLAO|nr:MULTISPECIES: RagB/SusD family nutrient uptake outer membrane protein [Maribacter]HAF78661.1 RagB/SusD family nutrient uptake outer membrane protein [Maribacter sp.]APA64523.1 carbohydrate-binding protein SusD [Maribacter sp. 1_2014MBL_MicDiv]KSA12594.1 RagB/SusD domain-containing protein [Maribacter dokdonensis DSW-8]MBU2900354.1 RagB/SusD family nutrient uptake outer membrane protein [Maribacter dokdonensis]CAG2531666.1 Starch-binding associating with outer membrane [Maribacter dokdonensi|tara:strand:+ start:1796 stop:3673 length:1878 start_codon:yes stop_codon:yes gene_type:complete
MKKGKLVLLGLLTLALVPISCNEDFLETQPLDSISADATWADGALAQAFVFNVYASLGYGGFEEEGLASLTDEAMFTHSGRGVNVITEGSLSPSGTGNVNIIPQWNELYLAIRKANIALQELPNSTFDDQTLKDRLTGEAHFLRAYYYHQLMRYYGGAPLIDAPYGLDDDYSIARGTYAENVDFVTSDLDKAISLLEGKEVTPGRASMLSAMGLKSRVLTYAASDLRDGPTASAKSATLGGYSNLELVAYTSGDRDARWNAAKTAAKAVLDATTGYKLDLTEPASAEEATETYISIAMGGGSAVGDAAARSELLFERTHSPLFTQESNWPLGGIHQGINNGPNGYHNWAGNTPIQQLVDDYQMMDGSDFDWSNEEHAAAPYENRDPRMAATILYDGAAWKPRPDDVASIDPYDEIQTGTYADGSGGIIPGVDMRDSPIENWNGSRTGYYVRKFIDPDPSLVDNQSSAQVVPWPFIRYTEIILNYVEASIALGDEGEARNWLNKIRFRAGMPALTSSGTELLEDYINERRVELAYEEHRYHDARRWMIADQTLGRGIKVMKVTATLKAGATPRTPYQYDTSVYDYTYTVVDNNDNETRTWDDKMYFMPISRDEINRNNLLIQNPGY